MNDQQPYEEPTPTQKIWQPVSDLDKEQQQAFQALMKAMNNNDLAAAKEARQRIDDIEAEQMRAHEAARAYLLKKVSHKGTVQV